MKHFALLEMQRLHFHQLRIPQQYSRESRCIVEVKWETLEVMFVAKKESLVAKMEVIQETLVKVGASQVKVGVKVKEKVGVKVKAKVVKAKVVKAKVVLAICYLHMVGAL
tara:strand:+ start:117 stop:446 length:330 start_codon:yes stop_codon:yes gene_type:complete